MTVSECDIIRGITYKRFQYDPSKFDTSYINVILINRVKMRKIQNEREIIDMFTNINKTNNVYIFQKKVMNSLSCI